MKKLIVNAVIAVVLFSGSLVGGLAATGRLNHDGVANIPLLNSFFSPPPPPADGEGAGPDGGPVDGALDAGNDGAGQPAEASLADGAAGPQDLQGTEGPRRTKTGRSVLNPDEPVDDGHGGGHGEDTAGAQGSDGDEGRPADAGGGGGSAAAGEHSAARDFSARELAMAQEKADKYAPGGYFKFSGMPAGLTPEQLNEAWQRVQGVLQDLEHRKTALDLREKELAELADDIGRRHLELGRLREEINTAQRALDDRITKFQEQVKLVRNDEVEALRRNAQTLESFEPAKAAELVTEQWGSEQGQTEILKTFEFMNKDKVNAVINELANPLIQDVLKKRLLVSKESAAPGKRRK